MCVSVLQWASSRTIHPRQTVSCKTKLNQRGSCEPYSAFYDITIGYNSQTINISCIYRSTTCYETHAPRAIHHNTACRQRACDASHGRFCPAAALLSSTLSQLCSIVRHRRTVHQLTDLHTSFQQATKHILTILMQTFETHF